MNLRPDNKPSRGDAAVEAHMQEELARTGRRPLAVSMAVGAEGYLQDMMDRPEDGDRWGRWVYHSNRTLLHEEGYEVDLDGMKDAASALDWILQVAHKTWSTNDDVAHLVAAIEFCLAAQTNLCPGAMSDGR